MFFSRKVSMQDFALLRNFSCQISAFFPCFFLLKFLWKFLFLPETIFSIFLVSTHSLFLYRNFSPEIKEINRHKSLKKFLREQFFHIETFHIISRQNPQLLPIINEFLAIVHHISHKRMKDKNSQKHIASGNK